MRSRRLRQDQSHNLPRVATMVAETRCDGPVSRAAEDAHAEVTQDGQHGGTRPGMDETPVLAHGHIFDVVQPVLDLPVPPLESQQASRIGHLRGQVEDSSSW